MTVPTAFETTPFFGREDELRSLDSLFASGVRIALISGPPGIGKSRLAFEFAERTFPSRWSFSSSLSEGLALDELSQRLALDSDLGGPSLIVLDDAEFVLDRALAHAHRSVQRAAQLRVLVTSRRVALATGVALFSVRPLDPSAARSLLASRAGLVSRDFDERALDAPSGLALRSSVGAIPAAIELAATRLRSLSVEELSARLSDDHDPLWTDAIGVSPRHRSLRALVTDSFAALDPAGSALVVALSACVGDFSLEAAEVLGAGPTPVVDALQSLADHSLLDRSTHEGRSRFALFAPLAQQIARDPAHAHARSLALRAHGEHFASLAERAAEGLYSSDAARWMALIERDRGNFEAVLARSLDEALGPGSLSFGARVASALLGYFENRGAVPSLRGWLDQLRAHPAFDALDPALIASLRFTRGVCAWLGGDVSASEVDLDAAIHHAALLGLTALEGRARARRLLILINTGRVAQVLDESERALALHRSAGDLRYEATTQAVASTFFVSCGAHDEARRRSDSAVSAARRVGDEWTLARALASRSILCLDIGQLEGARESIEEAQLVLDCVDFARMRATTTVAAAILEHLSANAERAEQSYLTVISLLERVGDRRLAALCLGFRGIALAQQCRYSEARRVLGRAVVDIEPFGDRWSHALLLSHRAVVEAMAGHGAEAAHTWAEANRVGKPVADLRLERVLAIQRARIETFAMNTARRAGLGQDESARRRASFDAIGALSSSANGAPPLFGYDVLIVARALLREEPAPEVRALIESALTLKKVLVAQRDGAWFWLSGEERRCDCTDAPVLQRVLAAFCAKMSASSDAVLSRPEFVEAVWPGERILPSAAKNRLHVAIAQLRARGLRDVIRTAASGYGLDPEVRILVVDDAVTRGA